MQSLSKNFGKLLDTDRTEKYSQLRLSDISTADRIYRLAFGTFVGLHDPMQFSGDADTIRTRFRADPSAALGAEFNGKLVGVRISWPIGAV
jgi:hypothetical protein